MKEFIKNLTKWLSIWLWIMLVLGIGYLAIKARQATNPWIADDGQGMYATNGTTLTAGKWNTLVQRSTWVDVPTTDTANFDINCERRIKSSANTYCANNTNWDMDMVRGAGNQLIVWRENWNRVIDKTAKTKIYLDGTRYCNISKLQKRCP